MKSALVNYSDSDSDDSKDHALPACPGRNLKRKRDGLDNAVSGLPPLPATFHDLYASTARVSSQDDPSMHAGRQRVLPHVEGSWPTHVYLEWYPSPTESNILSDIVSVLGKTQGANETPIHSLLKSDLGAELPLHISLSRPIMLLTDQRQSFAELLEHSILHSSIRPFVVSAESMDWVGNLEKTRWFLVLRIVKPGNDGLGKLLRTTNQAVESFGQPPLYSASQPQSRHRMRSRGTARVPRSTRGGRGHTLHASRDQGQSNQKTDEDLSLHFHISIGWTLHPPSIELVERTESISLGGIRDSQIPVKAVKVKVGNTVTAISLPTKVEEGKGLIGS